MAYTRGIQAQDPVCGQNIGDLYTHSQLSRLHKPPQHRHRGICVRGSCDGMGREKRDLGARELVWLVYHCLELQHGQESRIIEER